MPLHPTGIYFQSTLPVKGATKKTADFISYQIFSIHAPREGSDLYLVSDALHPLFQSTLPVKGATFEQWIYDFRSNFQSTLPVKGATLFRGADLI